MDIFEIQQCLESMEIVVDTREQPSKRADKRYAQFGCDFYRKKLDYGDYTYNFCLPNGDRWFPDKAKSIAGDVVIERKEDLTELAGNFFRSRERFAREFERSQGGMAKVYLLVENATWENLLNGKYRSKVHPNAYFSSITAFMARYDIVPIFCKEETSGRIIKEILYRELKERLEKGFYG